MDEEELVNKLSKKLSKINKIKKVIITEKKSKNNADDYVAKTKIDESGLVHYPVGNVVGTIYGKFNCKYESKIGICGKSCRDPNFCALHKKTKQAKNYIASNKVNEKPLEITQIPQE